MKGQLRRGTREWVHPTLFPIKYRAIELRISFQLGRDFGPNYVGVEVFDLLADDGLISWVSKPVTRTESVEQLVEILRDAHREALEHLDPF